jgi:hypothetical protein
MNCFRDISLGSLTQTKTVRFMLIPAALGQTKELMSCTRVGNCYL